MDSISWKMKNNENEAMDFFRAFACKMVFSDPMLRGQSPHAVHNTIRKTILFTNETRKQS